MDAAYVAVHLEEDRSHWWFRGRLAVILAALRRALPSRPVRLLELGCGSGNVLAALGDFGEAVGMDSHQLLEGQAVASLGSRDQAILVDAQRARVDLQTIERPAPFGDVHGLPHRSFTVVSPACDGHALYDHRAAKHDSK